MVLNYFFFCLSLLPPIFLPPSTAFLLQPLDTSGATPTLSAKDEPPWLPLRPPSSKGTTGCLDPKGPPRARLLTHVSDQIDTLWHALKRLPAQTRTLRST